MRTVLANLRPVATTPLANTALRRRDQGDDNMQSINNAQDGRVLIASISGETVTFATATSAGVLQPGDQVTYSSKTVTTFTDALQQYSRERDFALKGRQLVISVAGAVRGDTIRITNGRWFISISGLLSMFGVRPLVLNDASAAAWSTIMLQQKDLRPVDAIQADPQSMRARRAIIGVGEGLGAACFAYDDQGRPYVLDGEGGHMTCPLDTEAQRARLDSVRKRHGHLSYERAINQLIEDGGQHATDSADAKAMSLVGAGVLGSFAGNIALAYGAWGGVYITGPGAATLLRSTTYAAFRENFIAKGRFRTQLATVPVWTIERSDLALLGAAAFMRARAEAYVSPVC